MPVLVDLPNELAEFLQSFVRSGDLPSLEQAIIECVREVFDLHSVLPVESSGVASIDREAILRFFVTRRFSSFEDAQHWYDNIPIHSFGLTPRELVEQGRAHEVLEFLS